MSWITAKLLGVRNIDDASNVRAPRRPTLKIVGATLQDDEANDRTILTFTGVGLVAEVTAQAPLVVVANPDAAHPQIQITNATTSARGTMSAADKAKLDSIDAAALIDLLAAALLLDVSSTTLPNGRAIRALAAELAFEGASGIIPVSLAHKAAAGSVGRALRLRRTLTSGVGTPGTGVDLGWYLLDGFGAEALAGTDRVETTSAVGSTVVAKRVFALGGVDRLTIKSTGLLQAHAYTTGIPHFDASGNISSSLIVNADVDAAAGIECTKTDGNFGASSVLSDGGLEPATAGQPLILGSTAGDVDIGQTGVSTTTVHGNLVVTGTTTSINSTTVNFADRVCHVNASALGAGAVPVPTQIAGIAIDRGTADGTTKRDMPLLGWQESSGRILFCYNTAGDDQTVGAALTVACAGVQAVSAGTFKVGDSTITTSVEVDSTTGTVTFRAGGTVIGTVDVSAGYLRIRNGAGTTTGINLATTGAGALMQLTAAGAIGLESTGGKILLNAQNEIEIYDQGVLRGKIQMSAANTFGLETTAAGGRVNLTAEHLAFNAAAIGKVNALTSTTTPSFKLTESVIQRMTLTANVTASSWTDGVDNAEYEVQLLQDSTGGRTMTWPGGTNFPDNLGVNPGVPGNTPNTMTVWKFRRYSGAMLCTCVAKNITLP